MAPEPPHWCQVGGPQLRQLAAKILAEAKYNQDMSEKARILEGIYLKYELSNNVLEV